jgi:CRP-like cAMP-binding protein
VAIAGEVGTRTRSLFTVVASDVLPDIGRRGRRRRYPKGCVLMVQGDPAEAMHVILEGTVRVTRVDPDLQVRLHLADLGPGEVVGEIGVLSGNPRNATVTAVTDVVTLELGPSDVLHALKSVPGLSAALNGLVARRLREIEQLERMGKKRGTDTSAGASPERAFLGLLRGDALPRLRKCAQQVYFPSGMRIIRQGDEPDNLYLIEDGIVRVERMVAALSEPIHLADLGPGDIVGEIGVLTGAKRTATVTALTEVEALMVSRHNALQALLDVPGIPTMLVRLVKQRLDMNDSLERALLR